MGFRFQWVIDELRSDIANGVELPVRWDDDETQPVDKQGAHIVETGEQETARAVDPGLWRAKGK